MIRERSVKDAHIECIAIVYSLNSSVKVLQLESFNLNHEPVSGATGLVTIVRICNVHEYNRGSPTIVVVTIGAEKEAGGKMGSQGLKTYASLRDIACSAVAAGWTFALGI